MSTASDDMLKRQVDGIYADVCAAARGEWACERDGEQVNDGTISDYFSDALDIRYTVEHDRVTVCGGRVMVTCGGPNIWVTDEKVVGRWWGESYDSVDFPTEVRDTIVEWLSELFGC